MQIIPALHPASMFSSISCSSHFTAEGVYLSSTNHHKYCAWLVLVGVCLCVCMFVRWGLCVCGVVGVCVCVSVSVCVTLCVSVYVPGSPESSWRQTARRRQSFPDSLSLFHAHTH